MKQLEVLGGRQNLMINNMMGMSQPMRNQQMNMGSQQMSMGNQFGSSESGQPRVVMVPMMLMPDGSMLPFTNMQQFMTAQVLPQSSSLNESIVALN